MLVMKSHLHGEEEESLETFFGKLIRIMEFVKQIFLFLDSSCVGYHGDDNYVELCQVPLCVTFCFCFLSRRRFICLQ